MSCPPFFFSFHHFPPLYRAFSLSFRIAVCLWRQWICVGVIFSPSPPLCALYPCPAEHSWESLINKPRHRNTHPLVVTPVCVCEKERDREKLRAEGWRGERSCNGWMRGEGVGLQSLKQEFLGYVGMCACLFEQACAHSWESVHLVQWYELHWLKLLCHTVHTHAEDFDF